MKLNFSAAGGPLALLLTALIWGISFSAQRRGMTVLEPAVFNALRSLLGALALIPAIAVLDRLGGRTPSWWGNCCTRREKLTLCTGGLCCGIVLAAASLLQQWALKYASAGKAGFLTALYIVIVPILGVLFFHRRTGLMLWLAVLAALGGTTLLCSSDGSFSLTCGDWLLLGSAMIYALHILVIDHFAPHTDCVRMSALQFLVAAVISGVTAWIGREILTTEKIMQAALPLLFCGIFSSGVAYTLQVVGQKYVHPAAASLLLSLESVFALLGGAVLLGEKLQCRELCGCTVIFGAAVLAQLGTFFKKPNS